MANIKINYDKVNDTSLSYKIEAEEMIDIQNEMKDIFEKLNEAWKGKANSNFNKKFEVQIENLEYFITFLQNDGTFLDNISKRHGSSEDSFKEQMKKERDLYECRD